ncbi:MAG: hypothetical protein P8H59_11675 [Flavobacteriales bacterium]|nr:hypothetical protein [Flavobacteriales bacterium]MDG1781605.1 hypothetical protein [Flavobacteriales bacterium]
MIKLKHIFSLFALVGLLAMSSCQKLEEIEPGGDSVLPSRAVQTSDMDEDEDTTHIGIKQTRSGVDRPDDNLGNVNDDDDDEDDDEEQSLNNLPD